jgi:alkanesulfonate monooxygenase SsuD/methylene tetrahydromethanopterin reductase-like flavin-dependent oxidoreductase (luciferase family)
VGRGSISSQFHGFRIPIEENRARFDEALEIIRLAWTQERFSFRGRFWDIEELTVVPKPAQQPHPPIRVAVHTEESFAHLADKGTPIYSGTTTTPLPALREYMGMYRKRFAAAGHVWQPEQMALMLPVYLGDRNAMRPGVQRYYKNLETIFSAIPESYGEHLPRLRTISENAAHPPFDRFCRDNAAFGDTTEVIDRLQQAREEFSLSQIICWIDQGNMLPRGDVERVMRLFAERVMPKVA